jgi:adenylylsulfate reductase subunit B
MAVQIISGRCNECSQAKEPACVRLCPGDLFYRDKDGHVKLRDKRDCWDCAACVKSCPREAVEMYLPVQMGGRGATLTARTSGKKLIWRCSWPKGNSEEFAVEVKL